MSRQLQQYETVTEEMYTEDEAEHDNECDNCGQPSKYNYCNRECYLIGKADYMMDQEK